MESIKSLEKTTLVRHVLKEFNTNETAIKSPKRSNTDTTKNQLNNETDNTNPNFCYMNQNGDPNNSQSSDDEAFLECPNILENTYYQNENNTDDIDKTIITETVLQIDNIPNSFSASNNLNMTVVVNSTELGTTEEHTNLPEVTDEKIDIVPNMLSLNVLNHSFNSTNINGIYSDECDIENMTIIDPPPLEIMYANTMIQDIDINDSDNAIPNNVLNETNTINDVANHTFALENNRDCVTPETNHMEENECLDETHNLEHTNQITEITFVETTINDIDINQSTNAIADNFSNKFSLQTTDLFTATYDESPNEDVGGNHFDEEIPQSDKNVRRISIRDDLFPKLPVIEIENNSENYDLDECFKMPTLPSDQLTSDSAKKPHDFILSSSDFDFLLSKGTQDSALIDDRRSSLLQRFDPLLSLPSTADIGIKRLNLYQQNKDKESYIATPTILEYNEQHSLDIPAQECIVEPVSPSIIVCANNNNPSSEPTANVTMSVGLIEDMKPDDIKSFDSKNIKLEKDDIQMADLDRKIKLEIIKTNDLEKKLKEAELKEEALLKRITEKDKSNLKMSGVMEAYEKAIAELIAEKEQSNLKYEKLNADLTADRDLNLHHLSSLEATFSDLHAKYERLKQITIQERETKDKLMEDVKTLCEKLKQQEQRYDKMKSHAMQQLEIANTTLETLNKNHTTELARLKAQIKKEEISRQSLNEQLIQKSKENEELVKICDELINGQGS